MADYIRREDAMEITKRTCGDYATAWAEIRTLPIADVTEVIHCKDCSYFHPYPFEPKYGSCKYHLGPDLQWEEKKETDYCSDAERLEDVD